MSRRKMYLLFYASDKNSYEIEINRTLFPPNEILIHTSEDLDVLKQFKQNLECGFPKVMLSKYDAERSKNDTDDLISAVLEDNFERLLEEAVQNDFIFIPDGEFQETSNGDCQIVEESQIFEFGDINIEDEPKNNNFIEDDTSYEDEEPMEVSQSMDLPKIVIYENIRLDAVEGETSNASHTENVTQARQRNRGDQKKHSCFFCHKKVFKISRHYLTVHKDENEVRDLVLLPKKAPNRIKILNDLRKKGDYLHNKNKCENEANIVCKKGKGNEVCCPHCNGFYSKLSLRNHVRRCDPGRYKNQKSRLTIQPECRKWDNNIHVKASKDLRTKIFPYFREDDVVAIIRYDEAVIQYGNYLCRKYTSEHHAPQIRAHMRAFGKLLLTTKKINPNINNMFDLLDARNVPTIIEAINEIAGLNHNSGLFRAPATATSLGTELKRLCKLLQMEFIKTGDKENLKRMKNLMTIFEMEFQVTINKKGLETQKILKRRKTTILPTTAVISQFREFLEGKMEYFIGRLEKQYCKANWVKLVEHTLVHLAVFNRKRPGETQRILIEDFKHYEVLEDGEIENDDIISKEQSRKWARIKFTGKLGNDNALLIHRDLGFRAINLILKYREEAGVDKVNRYIFGEPSTYHKQKTFQACFLIRKLSEESGISNSELIRTRLLRQHLATETASKNVDTKLENRLSDFMSHNRKIHDVHYVLTKKKDDIVKVSTLLENFSSAKKPSVSENTNASSEDNHYNSGISSPNIPDYSDDDEDDISGPELALVLGKQSKRFSWGKEEIELVKRAFKREIERNEDISKAKVKEFFKENERTMRRRTPPLIIQWIKGEQRRQERIKENIKPKKERYCIEEQEVLEDTVLQHLKDETYPSLAECSYLIEKNDILNSRTPESIKTFVYNKIKKRRTM